MFFLKTFIVFVILFSIIHIIFSKKKINPDEISEDSTPIDPKTYEPPAEEEPLDSTIIEVNETTHAITEAVPVIQSVEKIESQEEKKVDMKGIKFASEAKPETPKKKVSNAKSRAKSKTKPKESA